MLKDRINKLKKEKNITNDMLAELSGVPKSTLAKITSGKTPNPKLETVRAIANVLGCTLDDLNDENENYSFYSKEEPHYNSLPDPVIIAASGGGLTNVDERMKELISDKQELCNAIYAANLDKRQIKELLGIVKTFEKI